MLQGLRPPSSPARRVVILSNSNLNQLGQFALRQLASKQTSHLHNKAPRTVLLVRIQDVSIHHILRPVRDSARISMCILFADFLRISAVFE